MDDEEEKKAKRGIIKDYIIVGLCIAFVVYVFVSVAADFFQKPHALEKLAGTVVIAAVIFLLIRSEPPVH